MNTNFPPSLIRSSLTPTDTKLKSSPEMKIQIVKMLGAFMSPEEIVRSFKKVLGISLSTRLIYYYRRSLKWAPHIEREREKYLRDLASIPIFHPKVRFVRYENLYNEALDAHDRSGMADALKLVQSEFKEKIGGDTYNQVFMTNQFNMDMSMEEIKARKETLLAKLQKTKEITDGSSG